MTQLNVLERGFKTSNTLPCSAEAGDDTLAVEQSVKLALRIWEAGILHHHTVYPRSQADSMSRRNVDCSRTRKIPHEVFTRTSSIFLLDVTVHFRIFE